MVASEQALRHSTSISQAILVHHKFRHGRGRFASKLAKVTLSMATDETFNVGCIADFLTADPAVNMSIGTVVNHDSHKFVFLEQGTLTDAIFNIIKPKIEEIEVNANCCMIFVVGRRRSHPQHIPRLIRSTVSGFDDANADNNLIAHVARKCTPRSDHAPSTVTTKIPIEVLYERSSELFRSEKTHPVTINLEKLLDLVPKVYYDLYLQQYCAENQVPGAAPGTRETARHSHTGFAIRVMLQREVFSSYFKEISQHRETDVNNFTNELSNLMDNHLRTMSPADISKMFRCAEDNLVAYYNVSKERLDELNGFSEIYVFCLWVKRAKQANVEKVLPLIEPPCMMCKWQFIDKFMGLLSGEGFHAKHRYLMRSAARENGDIEIGIERLFYDKGRNLYDDVEEVPIDLNQG